MRLISLELRDWRAYEHCLIEFPDGLIGVGGRNGAGKTTIAEAIGWALFKHLRPASKQGELRRQGAAGRPSVELVFQLADTIYTVKRIAGGEAHLWLGDSSGEPEASGQRDVTKRVIRELGLTWEVFERTIFAKQKDIAALDQNATGSNRRAHIERLLGLSRFRHAAEQARADQRSLASEIAGAEHHIEDAAVLKAELAEAERAAEEDSPVVKDLKRRAEEAEKLYKAARKEAERLSDTATKAKGHERDRAHARQEAADAKLALKEIEKQIRERTKRSERLAKIAADAELHPATRKRLDHYDELRESHEQLREAEEALEELGHDPDAASEDEDKLGALDKELEAVGSRSELVEADLEAISVRVAALAAVEAAGDPTAIKAALDETIRAARTLDRTRTQVEIEASEARQHLETVEGKGPHTPCPICGKPYGNEYESIVAGYRETVDVARDQLPQLESQVNEAERLAEKLRDDLEAARSAAKALAASEGPSKLEKAQATLASLKKQHEDLLRRVAAAKAEREPIAERSKAARTLASDFAAKSATVKERQGQFARAAGKANTEAYAAADHARIQTQEIRLAKIAEEAVELRKALAASAGLDERKSDLEAELADETEKAAAAKVALDALDFRPATLKKQREACDVAEKARDDLVHQHNQAALAAKERSEEVKGVRKRITAANKQRAAVEERRTELRKHELVVTLLDEYRQHEATRAWPSLEKGAGELLNAATEGRYADVRLTENDYRLSIVDRDEQIPLSRFSGGEQDLANLCLRLAIAEWVSKERDVGMEVLILDEVFGSLDEFRKPRLLEELRRLSDRFRQMLIITHVPEMAEACDQRIEVVIDPDGKSSAVVVS